MGVRRVTYLVFLFPVVASIALGSFVMAEVLEDYEWDLGTGTQIPGSSTGTIETLEIISLQSEYSSTDSIEVTISITDAIFDCGDLYITINDLSSEPKEVVTQSGFFNQCFTNENLLLPVDDTFSETISTPGTYELKVEMNDKDYKETITKSAKFTVN